MALAGKYWGNCVPTAFPENRLGKEETTIVYTKRWFKEKSGPGLLEIGHVCEPWLDARFLKNVISHF